MATVHSTPSLETVNWHICQKPQHSVRVIGLWLVWRQFQTLSILWRTPYVGRELLLYVSYNILISYKTILIIRIVLTAQDTTNTHIKCITWKRLYCYFSHLTGKEARQDPCFRVPGMVDNAHSKYVQSHISAYGKWNFNQKIQCNYIPDHSWALIRRFHWYTLTPFSRVLVPQRGYSHWVMDSDHVATHGWGLCDRWKLFSRHVVKSKFAQMLMMTVVWCDLLALSNYDVCMSSSLLHFDKAGNYSFILIQQLCIFLLWWWLFEQACKLCCNIHGWSLWPRYRKPLRYLEYMICYISLCQEAVIKICSTE